MKISEYLSPQRVVHLAAADKSAALAELAELVARDASLPADRLTEAIEQRERLMSTGIGQGIAIPHVRIDGVSEPMMALGISRDGLGDYESLDGQPVYIVVLIVAPKGQHEAYLRLLAAAMDVLKDQQRRQRLLSTETPQQAYELMTEGDE